jgi:uncharacterized protein YegL
VTTDTRQMEAAQEDTKVILPVYIAIDHSYSMSATENNAIDAANSLIGAIMDACAKHAIADERARFCIIGFNDEAEVVSELSRGTNLVPHTFVAERGTSFAEPFKLLKTQLVADHERLKADGFKTYRPAVFFITDGEPQDGAGKAEEAFAALTDENFAFAPNLSVFGVGQNVSEAVVKQYTSRKGRTFVTRNDVGAKEALGGFIGKLIGTVIDSTLVMGSGHEADLDDGVIWDLDLDEDDDPFYVEIES